MREITKKITLKVGEEEREFLITKLNAFAGIRLLKMEQYKTLDESFYALPDPDKIAMMKDCLYSVQAILPGGPTRVYEQGVWGIPELEHDTWTCTTLTIAVIAWTLHDFFPEKPPATPKGK